MDFVAVLKVQVFGNNRKQSEEGGVCWEQHSASSVEGKGPGTGNFSSSGIQPRSDLQVKDRAESVFKTLQNF